MAAYKLAERYLRKGSHENAERLFRQTIELLPDAPGPYRGLGMTMAAQGDCEEAIRAIETYREKLALVPGRRRPSEEAMEVLESCKARRQSLGSPKGGSLAVSSTPPGGQVLLDGSQAGISPLTMLDVPVGEHVVKIVMDGYTSIQQEVQVKEEQAAVVRARMVRTARLDLLSSPRGATVEIDDEQVGKTPVSLTSLDAGAHKLSLSLAGARRPWIGGLRLPPGGEVTLNVPLATEGGLLEIHSDPEGAMVTMDDAPVGHTPWGPNLVSEGSRWLRLALPGFVLVQRKVEVSRGATSKVETALEPVQLDLHLKGLVPGTTVFVDGLPREADEGWVRGLSPGEHEVAAWQEDYQIWSDRVILRQGAPAEIEARLAQVEDGSAGRTWWRVTTSAVAVGSLAGAAVCWYGAEDAEPRDYVTAGGLSTLGLVAAIIAVQSWLEEPGRPEPSDEGLDLHATMAAPGGLSGLMVGLGGAF